MRCLAKKSTKLKPASQFSAKAVRGYVHDVVISCGAEVIARHPRVCHGLPGTPQSAIVNAVPEFIWGMSV
jgi:hypothetical protein